MNGSNNDILIENKNRFIVTPIQYMDLWKLYEKEKQLFWVPDEIDFTRDLSDWNKLEPQERKMIKFILAFFAFADGVVNENIINTFYNEVKFPEARQFYGFQIAMENIHNQTYSLLIDTYIKNEKEKEELLNSVQAVKSIKNISDWAQLYMNDKLEFHERIFAFAILEGVMFQNAFACIFWFKKSNRMHGLTFSNELISRDEGLHYEFANLIYNKYCVKKLDKEKAEQITKDAFEVQKQYIKDMFQDEIQIAGINAELLIQSAQFLCDRHLVLFGYQKIYNVQQPFEYMNMINIDGKTNFFEKKVSEYRKAEFTNKNNQYFDQDEV